MDDYDGDDKQAADNQVANEGDCKEAKDRVKREATDLKLALLCNLFLKASGFLNSFVVAPVEPVFKVFVAVFSAHLAVLASQSRSDR